MARGNQGQSIFRDGKDRQRFLETLCLFNIPIPKLHSTPRNNVTVPV
jgi:hypothetical protein